MAALGRVRLSPWLIVLLAAGYLLDDGTVLMLGLVCVVLHEWGHAVCARAFGCSVDSIELAPFGGMARLAGLERMSEGCLVCIALAGPAVNVGLSVLGGCCAYLWPEHNAFFMKGMRLNAGLALFNLIPAHPLDGGQILFALLRKRMGVARAQRIAAMMGITVGAGMMGLGFLVLAGLGKVNLTLVICGAYLIVSGWRAHRQAPYACMQMLLGRNKELQRRRVLPVRTIAVPVGTTDAQAAAHLRAGAVYRVAYLDEEMHVKQVKWENELF